jgi:hypothetical protein
MHRACGETQRSCGKQMATLVKDCGTYCSSRTQVAHSELNLSTNILTPVPWPKALDVFLGQRSEQYFSLSRGSHGASELPISLYVAIIDKPVHGSIPDADHKAECRFNRRDP